MAFSVQASNWVPNNPVTNPDDTTVGALPWENASNWDTASYPGQIGSLSAKIEGGIATVSTALANSIGELRVNGDGAGIDGALNIATGADVEASSFVMGWGKEGVAIVNQTGGTLDVTPNGTQLSRPTGGDSFYNISGGVFHMGDAGSSVGRSVTSLQAELNISGGSVTSGDATGDHVYLYAGSTINVSGSGTFTNTADIRNYGTLHVSGSSSAVNIGWYYRNYAGSTTKFTLDAAGVSPIYLLFERVSIDPGSSLIVDVSAYNIANGTNVLLVDYGRKNITGTWDSVTITGGTANVDYDFGGFNQVYLTDITVAAPLNYAPVVDAGADKNTWMSGASAVVELADGLVVDDGLPVSAPVTHTWTLDSTIPGGLTAPAITSAGSLDTTVTFYETGIYIFELETYDTEFYGSDTVSVTVHETMCDVLKLADHYIALEGDSDSDCSVNLPDFATNVLGWVGDMGDVEEVTDNWLDAKTERDLYARTFKPAPAPYVHPRILFNAEDLPAIKDRLDNGVFGQALWTYIGTGWFANAEVTNLAALDLSGGVTLSHVQTYWENGGESRNIRFFTTALKGVLYNDTASKDLVIDAIVNLSKIIVASKTLMPGHSTWADNGWGLGDAWINGGEGMALAYDILYNDMTTGERADVRLAIATATEGRRAWGMGFPEGRIISNWAMYNGNLITMILAIEGETGYDSEVYDLYATMATDYFNHAVSNRVLPSPGIVMLYTSVSLPTVTVRTELT